MILRQCLVVLLLSSTATLVSASDGVEKACNGLLGIRHATSSVSRCLSFDIQTTPSLAGLLSKRDQGSAPSSSNAPSASSKEEPNIWGKIKKFFTPTMIIIVSASGGVALLLTVLLCWFCYRRRKRGRELLAAYENPDRNPYEPVVLPRRAGKTSFDREGHDPGTPDSAMYPMTPVSTSGPLDGGYAEAYGPQQSGVTAAQPDRYRFPAISPTLPPSPAYHDAWMKETGGNGYASPDVFDRYYGYGQYAQPSQYRRSREYDSIQKESLLSPPIQGPGTPGSLFSPPHTPIVMERSPVLGTQPLMVSDNRQQAPSPVLGSPRRAMVSGGGRGIGVFPIAGFQQHRFAHNATPPQRSMTSPPARQMYSPPQRSMTSAPARQMYSPPQRPIYSPPAYEPIRPPPPAAVAGSENVSPYLNI